MQNEKGINITSIRNDRGREFEKNLFNMFCVEHGIEHTFSAPYTPQHNGVVERKYGILQKLAKSMTHECCIA